MMTKAVFVFCAQALLIQSISSQCIGAGYGIADGMAWGPWNGPYMTEAPVTASWASAPCAATPFATAEWATGYLPANGGGFPVTSASPIAVTGVSMTSENAYEGPLRVSGAAPFLGAVALEGALPTAGAGAIDYGCGSGGVAMLSERVNALGGAYGAYGYGPLGVEAVAAPGYGYGYGPLGVEAVAAPGYGYGYNRGCGCGAL